MDCMECCRSCRQARTVSHSSEHLFQEQTAQSNKSPRARTRESTSNDTSSAAQQPSPDDPGHHLRGVSATYMDNVFLAEVAASGLPETAKVFEVEPLVIRGKGKDVTCPRDGKLGAAYVDCVPNGPGGSASVMLSYGWQYSVRDVVDTLLQFCLTIDVDPNDTRFWICCVCINQHRVQEAVAKGHVVPFDTFRGEFQARVTSIGHLLAMMAPWNSPLYVTRVWCVLELFTAVESGCRVTVGMPPVQAEAMQDAMLQDQLQKLWDLLGSTSVANAQATIEDDRVRILQLIEQSVGFAALDARVSEFLRDWVLKTCETNLTQLLNAETSNAATARACKSIGRLLFSFGKLEQAAELLERGKQILLATGTLGTADGADLLMNTGATKSELRDFNGALKEYVQARRVREATETLRTHDGARLLMYIGTTKRELGDLDGAAEVYEEARNLRQATGTLQTSCGARLLMSIGIVKCEQGESAAALKEYAEARKVREATETLVTPHGAKLLKSIGDAKCKLGDIDGAMKEYDEAKRVYTVTGTSETPVAIELLQTIKALELEK